MPNLSIIVTGRNDDYDGNFDERLIMALSKNIVSLPDAEFIFVEWNPIPKKRLTSEKIQMRFGNRIKCYVVDPKYHERYCTIDEFLEYPAKNVGVRRAKGDFILCMNSDVIFAPDTVNAMKGTLKRDVVYRTSRIDIQPEYMDVHFPVPKRYFLCENKGLMNAAGDFLLMDRGTWFHITGYCEEFRQQRLHKDAFIVWQLVDQEKYPVEFIGAITHWRHPSSWSNGFRRARVGDTKWDFTKCGYTRNKGSWGLTFAKEQNRNGIIWLV